MCFFKAINISVILTVIRIYTTVHTKNLISQKSFLRIVNGQVVIQSEPQAPDVIELYFS